MIVVFRNFANAPNKTKKIMSLLLRFRVWLHTQTRTRIVEMF